MENLVNIDYTKLDKAEQKIRLKHLGIWQDETNRFLANAFKEAVELIEDGIEPHITFPMSKLARKTAEESFAYFYTFFYDLCEETKPKQKRKKPKKEFVDEIVSYMDVYNANKMRELTNKLKAEAYLAVERQVYELEDRILQILLFIANTFIPRSAVFVIASGMNGALIQLAKDILEARGLPTETVYFKWKAVLDPATCERCWIRHDRIISSANPLFITIAPPVHPFCRCVLEPVYGENIEEDSWDDVIGMPTDFPRTWYQRI